jgi:hypothetical protein
MLNEKHIDAVIRRNIKIFRKKGVTSIRPGFKCHGGWLTHEPAIVVSVKRKKTKVTKSELLPKSVEGVPVDVREVSRLEALKATNPVQFAKQMAKVPEGNEPADQQVATFPLERNTKGKLITPAVNAAVTAARSQTTAKIKAKASPKKAVYQKLPAAALAEINGSFKVTCVASPDAGWPTLKPFLAGVQNTLTVGIYEFTAPWIAQTVTARLAKRKLNLVLDDPSYDTEKRNQTESQTQAQLSQSIGPGFKFAWAAEAMDPHCTVHLFPSAYHIKVAVKDGNALWLSSGNWNETNQPNIAPVTTPVDRPGAAGWDRDWHVIIENTKLAGVFENSVLRDLTQATPGQKSAQSKAGTKTGRPSGKPITTFFPAQTFSGTMRVQPVLTPDNYVDVILPLILGAKKSFWMQTQYINPSKTFAADMLKPLAGRSILERLVSALATIQANKVDVKIILGQTVTATMLEQLQMFGKLDATTVRLQDNVHNKGMIIDSSVVVVGSQNWSTEGVDTNRDASVVIKNTAIAAYWEQIFLLDWNERTHPPDQLAK